MVISVEVTVAELAFPLAHHHVLGMESKCCGALHGLSTGRDCYKLVDPVVFDRDTYARSMHLGCNLSLLFKDVHPV